MRNAFAIAYEGRLKLTRVTARILPFAPPDEPMLVELVLGFEGNDVTLAVTDEDEIEAVPRVFAADETIQEVDLADVAPWNGAIGQMLRWTWEMTNQQGYTDGVQIEFGRDPMPDSASEPVTIQLIALGAQLRVHVVSPGFLP